MSADTQTGESLYVRQRPGYRDEYGTCWRQRWHAMTGLIPPKIISAAGGATVVFDELYFSMGGEVQRRILQHKTISVAHLA